MRGKRCLKEQKGWGKVTINTTYLVSARALLERRNGSLLVSKSAVERKNGPEIENEATTRSRDDAKSRMRAHGTVTVKIIPFKLTLLKAIFTFKKRTEGKK